MTRFGLLIALSSSLAAAQAPSSHWEISGNVGAGFRKERGHLLGGARLGAALSKSIDGSERRVEFGLGYAQLTAHEGPTGDGANVKENSIEMSVMGEWPLYAGGGAHISAALGPVLAYSVGCTHGGDFDADEIGYSGACTNEFARAGNVRVGGTARLTTEFRAARGSLIIGAIASAGTIAAGNALGLAGVIGFRAALR